MFFPKCILLIRPPLFKCFFFCVDISFFKVDIRQSQVLRKIFIRPRLLEFYVSFIESNYAIPEPDSELVAALALFLVCLFIFFIGSSSLGTFHAKRQNVLLLCLCSIPTSEFVTVS